ncbi:neutral ceramidase [Saccharopolyspora antimicrobica]|uniref:Neutral ceramidase n=1 Tax=Saccharopolyspora antimicrobica TaxID=455193 RepID=A0A1I4YIN9_9PSEU|nr:neutral/alkaline ceramidase [Saccharopolyspora antimicrobica]RKT82691.1 neutral ceramidase [Saccharopolyspora antimicrobica]SFN37886.1 neutral ceramidase [Saccharopolyspora antimicrobica]
MPVARRQVLAAAAAAPLVASTLGGTSAAAETVRETGDYLVGRGIADVTGPAAENGMMGYSMPQQQTAGIHLRTLARAFVVADGEKRIAFVTAELGAVFQSVHQGVLRKLRETYGDLYTEQNVLLNATHTHAACGGDSHYAAYDLAILGFQEQTYNAVVDGITEAISRAHADLKPGTAHLGRAVLTDASANRSRSAFDLNPQPDKDHFPLGIDPAVTVLRFAQGSRDVGAITWFATHGTSMTNTNRLISSDNKGYAAFAWEQLDADFVACFAQTNAGDMSPNLNLSPGSGPTEDEFENTRIIGDRQFRAAKRAFDAAQEQITGAVDHRMCFVDLSKVTVDGRFTPDGEQHTTCTAAIGVSMLAGSREDGPGLPIPEGIRNPFLDWLGGADAPIPDGLADAQAPKPIAVPFGAMKPYPWCPEVLPLQLIRIGQLHLVTVPAECTIVAGLRLRQAVADELGVPLENVLVQGYANAYSQYVTTPEEYDAQQYEGASTLFGRYTLPAYQQEFARLAAAMRSGASVPPGPTPRDLRGKLINFQPGVVFDDKPPGREFGDVLTEPATRYRRAEQVTAEFVTGHPKNDLRTDGTFAEVQRQVGGEWRRVADDRHWSTKYHWTRSGAATSTAKITWDIPPSAPAGRYRIVHHGNWKNGWNGEISAFTGTTRAFVVT